MTIACPNGKYELDNTRLRIGKGANEIKETFANGVATWEYLADGSKAHSERTLQTLPNPHDPHINGTWATRSVVSDSKGMLSKAAFQMKTYTYGGAIPQSCQAVSNIPFS